MRNFCLTICLFSCLSLHGQEKISNRKYFKNFFQAHSDKSLLIVGENHASSVGSTLYPDLIKYLNKKTGLNTLLIEFGPAEAFFYSKYLETGDEKHLNYTIYAGSFTGWRKAWRTIYQYNKTLDTPLKVVGIDFDRTRTLAYALYSIFMTYEQRPDFVETLMNEIKTDEFYNTYTIDYPNKKDIEWTLKTKNLLKEHFWELKLFLNARDLEVVTRILKNKVVKYGDKRERGLAENTQRIIESSEAKNHLLLIGRSHAYHNPIYGHEAKLAKLLTQHSEINVLTGVILFQNSVLWGGADKNEAIRLFEIKNKIPWKKYYSELNQKKKDTFRVIPLVGDLRPLTHYTDYILLARDQSPYELRN